MMRPLTINEMMILQGVNPAFFHDWESIISERQMGRIIGNAMTQTIMEKAIYNAFLSVGIPVKPA